MSSSEYLGQIGSLAVVVDVDGQSVAELTGVNTSGDRLAVSTRAKNYNVRLPIEVDADSKLAGIKNAGEGCIAMGLKVRASMVQTSFMKQNITKWSSGMLNDLPKHTFNCNSCSAPLLRSEHYKYMDMPSEFWYEMMDFWHCHKPTNNTSSMKDYRGVLTPPNSHTVLIGSHYLLVDANEHIEVVEKRVRCASCKESLGEVHQNTCRLNKWQLQLQYNNHTENYSSYLFVHNSILDKINSLATRRFKFQHAGKWWIMWVVGLGLEVTVGEVLLHESMKILYRSQIEDVGDDYETLAITYPEIMEKLVQRLIDTNHKLPSGARQHQMANQVFDVSYLCVN